METPVPQVQSRILGDTDSLLHGVRGRVSDCCIVVWEPVGVAGELARLKDRLGPVFVQPRAEGDRQRLSRRCVVRDRAEDRLVAVGTGWFGAAAVSDAVSARPQPLERRRLARRRAGGRRGRFPQEG